MNQRNAYAEKVVAQLNVNNYANLLPIFDQAIEQYADRIAFTALGQDLTFAEVEQYSRQFGAWLLSDGGLQKGDRVAVQLPNLLQYPIAAWGI
ncbi:MAG: AMP-binding protein, partial [Arenicella sp.]|nr:AMP-binding protein [Arenicella sp.]